MAEELIGNVFDIDGFTRFEKTRVIGARALQIAMGAPVLVKPDYATDDPITLARMEFEKGAVPISVRRKMPKRLEE